MTTTTPPGPSCKRGDVALALFPDSNLRTEQAGLSPCDGRAENLYAARVACASSCGGRKVFYPRFVDTAQSSDMDIIRVLLSWQPKNYRCGTD
jgi:hypothetical protein